MRWHVSFEIILCKGKSVANKSVCDEKVRTPPFPSNLRAGKNDAAIRQSTYAGMFGNPIEGLKMSFVNWDFS